MALNVDAVKKDFPILERQTHGHRLVYLDSEIGRASCRERV